MKKKSLVTLITVPIVAVMVTGYFYTAKPDVVSAQREVTTAADKAAISGKIEYIKETLSDGSYTVRIRDKENLTEVTEEYRDNKLQSKIIIEDKGKKITSVGRDHETGKLVGRTWTMPENLAAENERLLGISLLEKQKEEFQSQDWSFVESNARPLSSESGLTQAESENEYQKEVVTIDEKTGLPIKREIFTKDKNGNITGSFSKTEEYKYLDSIPNKIQGLTSEEEVDMKEVPAPVIEDKVLEG
ncbi:MAG TPA: hypothetical protein VGI33_03145 [Paenibacillus sp.]|jgi:hypothetical protein